MKSRIAGIAVGMTIGVINLKTTGWWDTRQFNFLNRWYLPPFNSFANAKVAVFWRFWQQPDRRERFRQEITNNGAFLSKWMIFAFFLESIMISYIPAHWITNIVGAKSTFALPLASIVGIPAYMNGYARDSPNLRPHGNGNDPRGSNGIYHFRRCFPQSRRPSPCMHC